MVRALLDGRKTQTRRVVANANSFVDGVRSRMHFANLVFAHRDVFVDKGPSPAGNPGPYLHVPHADGDTTHRVYPQWVPGDRLWVRETFTLEHAVESDQPPPFQDGRPVKYRPVDDVYGEEPAWLQPHYRATDPQPELEYENRDEPGCRWRPSIFMPRWASRIALEITDVRAQRLQDISEDDAGAEGCGPVSQDGLVECGTRKTTFRQLWDSINGSDAWDANPWVWALTFRRVDA